MNVKQLINGAAGALLVCGLAGCAAGGEDQASERTLFDTQIPEDFTFATTKGLTVTADGDPAGIAQTLAEIRIGDGELVHRGPLLAPVQLAIPRSVDTLQVTLRSNTYESVVEVPVVDGRAVIEMD